MRSVMRNIGRLMALLLLCGSVLPAFALAQNSSAGDLDGHWAEARIADWARKGWVTGYADGSFQPDRPVTRAEFITFINRSFDFQDKAEISFRDVSPDSWEYEQVAKAVKAGILQGFDDRTIRPGQAVSRQEAAVMVARLANLSDNKGAAAQFTDYADVAEWAAGAVGAAAEQGLISGYPDGTYKPAQSITRAEAVVVLDRALALQTSVFDTAGTYGPAAGTETIRGNVTVETSGVTLQNMLIAGDLLLAEGVGEGDVILDNVEVMGKTIVQGGGANSIHLIDTVLLTVVVDKKQGTVRLVAEGASSVREVQLQSAATIEENGVTGAGFAEVKLTEWLPSGSKVTLVGEFESVDVSVKNITLDIPRGSVGQLNVTGQSGDVEIHLGETSNIVALVLEAAAKIAGQGTIEKATIGAQASSSSFEKAPASREGPGAGTGGSTGGGGSGGGGGGNSVTPKTATPTVTGTVYADASGLAGTAEPGAQIVVSIGSLVIGEGTAQADGTFSITFTPNTTLTADTILTITAKAANKTVSGALTVQVMPVTSTPPVNTPVYLEYLAHSSFIIQTEERTALIDPWRPHVMNLPGYEPPITAKDVDFITISHHHDDHNYKDAVTGATVIEGTIVEDFITQTQTYQPVTNAMHGDITLNTVLLPHFGSSFGPGYDRDRANAAFIYDTSGMRIVHMGDAYGAIMDGLSTAQVADLKGAGGIDVLMLPIGSYDMFSPIDRDKLIEAINALEPKVVIPMHPWETLDSFVAAVTNAAFTVNHKGSEIELNASELPNGAKPEIWVMEPRYQRITDLTTVSVTDTTATLSFSAPVGATSVILQKYEDFMWSEVALAEPLNELSTSVTVDQLVPETSYTFRLWMTGGTRGGPSNAVDVETLPAESNAVTFHLELFDENDQKMNFTLNPDIQDQGEIVVDQYEYFLLKLVAGYDEGQISGVKAVNTTLDVKESMTANSAVYLSIDVFHGTNEINVIVTDKNNNDTVYSFRVTSSVQAASSQYDVALAEILNVPSDTSVSDFLEAIDIKEGATKTVYTSYDNDSDTYGTEVTDGTVQDGYILTITGPDPQLKRNYTIRLAP